MALVKHRQLTVRRLLILILVGTAFFNPTSARALTDEQRKVFDSGVRYFNVEASSNCGNTGGQFIGSDNVDIAFHYFIGKGLSANQSAGIVGNLIFESGVNPAQQEKNPISGRGGYGIAQWTGGRREALESAAQQKGVDVSDLAFQLDYLWSELQGPYKNSVLVPLQASTTLEDATNIILYKFEAPRSPNPSERLELAQGVISTYGSGINSFSSATTQNCLSSIGNGQNTRFVDGFTVYSQIDPAWKDLPYGSSTIGLSGCGPSAMAMIITTLTGQSINPKVAADYASSQGLYVHGQGSKWSIGAVLAEHWSLKATAIGANLDAISSTLQSGGLVIAAGKGPEPFTSGGHFIVIRGITADGKFKVGDSFHDDANDKDWDPQQLLASMASSSGSVYGITK